MPPFFNHPHGEGKKAAILKLRSSSTDLRLSYIDCTLVNATLGKVLSMGRDNLIFIDSLHFNKMGVKRIDKQH